MTFEIVRFESGLAVDGSAKTLGGKGVRLCEMASEKVNVPPGFILKVDLCLSYQQAKNKSVWMDSLMASDEIIKAIGWLGVGDECLVSVRSAAPVSMPGMLDTILNIGLIPSNTSHWEEVLGDRLVWDCYRRLCEMYGEIVFKLGIELEDFRKQHEKRRKKIVDKFSVEQLKSLSMAYLELFDEYDSLLPQTCALQIRGAIESIFKSWSNERAIAYREANNIPHSMGMAVIVEKMVYGNNENSGSGVMFTRNPATGENEVIGEYLACAQGEDVVAGIRTPTSLEALGKVMPSVLEELLTIASSLEKKYGYPQDIEFTIEDGVLYFLQTRNMKRTSLAAFKIVVDMVEEGYMSKEDGLSWLEPEDFFSVGKQILDPEYLEAPIAVGISACPGVASGLPVRSSLEAVVKAKEGPVILVTEETSPDDFEGMRAAEAIVTINGGFTCHAAVVARAMNKPCIVGVSSMNIFSMFLRFDGKDTSVKLNYDEMMVVDGGTGKIWAGEVPVIDGSKDFNVMKVISWLYEAPGMWRLSDKVNGNRSLVILSDWLFLDSVDDLIEELGTALIEYGVGNVALDIGHVGRRIEDSDRDIWLMFGGIDDLVTKQDKLVARIFECKTTLKGLIVIGAEGRYTVPKEMMTVRTVSTVKEMLEGGSMIMTDQFVDLLGGVEVCEKLKSVADMKIEPFVEMTLVQRVLDLRRL